MWALDARYPQRLVHMRKEELQKLDELYKNTTPGKWVSYIEGRDHESGSCFIKTEGADIELTGAKNEDQDFIALVHQFYPEFRENYCGTDLVGLVTDTINRTISTLRDSGCINDSKLNKQYYAGSELYNKVTEIIESSVKNSCGKK